MSVVIGVLGAQGRMGKEVISALASTRYTEKAKAGPQIDQGGDLAALLSVDAIVDFSAPQAVQDLVAAGEKSAKLPVLIVGSTGWNLDGKRVIEKWAEKAPAIMASNFSTGVLALMEILRRFTPLLDKMGYTPVITEVHHKHKKDSPSGTALSLQRSVSISPGNVQTQSVRAGEVIGDHTVTFYGSGDQLAFTHHAQDRSIFATGAIDAAIWLHEQRTSGKISKGLTGLEPYFKDLLARSGIPT